jgi:hypothetical protein
MVPTVFLAFAASVATAACPAYSTDRNWMPRKSADLIVATQALTACSVDAQLPPTPLSEWLLQQVGPRASLHWTVEGGCLAKPEGAPPFAFPLCIQVLWRLSNGDGGQVMLRIGSMRSRDHYVLLTEPLLEWLTVFYGSGPDAPQFGSGDLHDLPRLLRGRPDRSNAPTSKSGAAEQRDEAEARALSCRLARLGAPTAGRLH